MRVWATICWCAADATLMTTTGFMRRSRSCSGSTARTFVSCTAERRARIKLADKVAVRLGIPKKAFPADWDKHGKAAGAIRNIEMAQYLEWCRRRGHSVQVIAFPGGTGTNHMVAQAEARDIVADRL
jgi:hypothetical protein